MAQPLIISAPNQGISSSPNFGFGNVVNLDIHTLPGVVRLNNKLEKKTATTVTGLVNWIVKNPVTPTEVYALDDGGKVYRSADSGATWALMTGNTQSACHGNGLAIWKNYLIVARDAFLDVCGDGASSGNGTTTGISNAGWTNSWKAIDSDVLWHPMITSYNDSKLYGGAGKYVFSLEELSTFVPATAGTFTWTAQVLDLPSSYRIKCLAEQGTQLMIGTWQGTTVNQMRVADIFPWSRSILQSFSAPIKLDEFGVHSMININGMIYMICGIEGRLYSCNGVQASPIAQIPSSISDLEGGKYLEANPGALLNYKGRLFFGISSGGTSETTDGCGVWSLLQTSRGNILTLEQGISSGNFGSTSNIKIVALCDVSRDKLLVGWKETVTT